MYMAYRFTQKRMQELACDDAHWTAISNRLDADPMDPDALFACAAYFASNHLMDEALEILDELSKVKPDYPGLWRFKARVFEEMGNKELASECWERGNDSP